jgi:hypothetical protein
VKFIGISNTYSAGLLFRGAIPSVKVSVIIASRLQLRPHAGPESLWLDRALRSVRRQTAPEVELEIVIGLDPGAILPPRFASLVAANATRPCQADALNAAVAAATGEVLAFLEDDDYWEPRRLQYGLRHLNRFVDEDGSFVAINDYPTPSGWLLRRATWENVGPFDDSYTFVDSEWLGRANLLRLRRLHLIEAGPHGPRRRLEMVQRFSAILATQQRDPLVLRTVNPHGVVGAAQAQEEARRRHERDVQRMIAKYGDIPW